MKYLALVCAAIPFAASAADPVTIESCGREVTFDSVPEAVISNDINLTEIMLALELEDHMVGYTGISGWNKLTPELSEKLGDLPELSPKYPTKEVLLGAGADFYFAGWNYGMKVGGEVTPETLEPYGIDVYELTESCIHIGSKSRSSMDDLYVDILNLGKIFRVEERAQALVDGYKAELAEYAPPRVFVYDGSEPPFTSGEYAMPTALIEAAGGHNVIDDIGKSWANVNWEVVVDKNPQLIIIVNYGEVTAEEKRQFVMEHEALGSIDAVKNDQFLVLEYTEVTPGPRNIGAVRKIASALAGI